VTLFLIPSIPLVCTPDILRGVADDVRLCDMPGSRMTYVHSNHKHMVPSRSELKYLNKYVSLKLLTPNVNYSGRTAHLTSKVAFHIFIQQI